MNRRKPRNWTTDALVATLSVVVNVILGMIVGDNILAGRAALVSPQGIVAFVWTLVTLFLCLLAFRSWSHSLYHREG
jgi:sterol desaturase/sphingolipid hydroxylase (fatty acid hydroxylase superfamily)